MIYCGIGDEGGNLLSSQIAATQELGWQHLEVRNVTLPGLGGRQQAQIDALQCAKHWATLGFAALSIDTSLQPTGHAQALAALMNARYMPMPHIGSERMVDAMKFVAKN